MSLSCSSLKQQLRGEEEAGFLLFLATLLLPVLCNVQYATKKMATVKLFELCAERARL